MYPSFTARMRGLRPNLGGQTIAEGIAVKTVGDLTYAIARPLIEEVLLLEEPDLERAVALYANVEKTVAEGAGAASLAALLAFPSRFRGKRVGLVLCGGNIDTRLLASVLTRELIRERRITRFRIVGDDRPGPARHRVVGDRRGRAATSSRCSTTAWRWTCRPRARSSTSWWRPATAAIPTRSPRRCASRAIHRAKPAAFPHPDPPPKGEGDQRSSGCALGEESGWGDGRDELLTQPGSLSSPFRVP